MSLKRFLYFVSACLLSAHLACDNAGEPITLSTTDLNVSVDENLTAGTVITTVSGTTNQGSLTFSIASQSVEGATAVDATSGELSIADASAFDFETNPTLTVSVSLANGNVSQVSQVNITLNDVGETVTITDATVTLDENPTQGQVVATVATEVDFGSPTFVINSQSPAGAFEVNESTGTLSVLDATLFDFETNPTFTIELTATNGIGTDAGTIVVNLNDIFEVSWTQATASAGFGAVYGHQIVELNGVLYMIGGIRNSTRINEVWSSSDGSTWTQVSTMGSLFSARNAHQALVFNNQIWVIGGTTDTGLSNEIWSSADGINWTEQTTSGIFAARTGHAATVFNNQIYVVGGTDGSLLNDVWSSSDGTTWTQVTTDGTIFSARQGHTLNVFNDQLTLIAGADLDNDQATQQNNDIWTSSDGISWSQVTVTSGAFAARSYHGAVVYNDLLWMIGGVDGSGNGINTVWSSADGAIWNQQPATPVFDAREQMAAFVFNNQIWVSGGSNAGSGFEDIWRTN